MVGWWFVACGLGPDPAAAPPALPLCPPWDTFAPADGRVVTCDERRLHVRYPAGTADDHAPDWRAALEGRGWVVDLDTSAPGAVSVRYRGDDGLLALTLLDTPNGTELGATRIDP